MVQEIRVNPIYRFKFRIPQLLPSGIHGELVAQPINHYRVEDVDAKAPRLWVG